MATYVLVHGSWHGAWCWYRVVAELQRRSHTVIAPDLLALGRDLTPPGSVTLDAWTDQIAACVQGCAEPVVLVGHSRGGIIVSQVAERMPERIRALVYVSAFLLEAGDTLGDAAARDPDSLVLPSMRIAADGQSASILESAVREVFYGLSSAEDAILGQSLLRPEPLGPISTPIRTTGGRFGRVPRRYIECAADRAITPAAQRRMQTALPCRRLPALQADHSPFFSAPLALTNLLTDDVLAPF